MHGAHGGARERGGLGRRALAAAHHGGVEPTPQPLHLPARDWIVQAARRVAGGAGNAGPGARPSVAVPQPAAHGGSGLARGGVHRGGAATGGGGGGGAGRGAVPPHARHGNSSVAGHADGVDEAAGRKRGVGGGAPAESVHGPSRTDGGPGWTRAVGDGIKSSHGAKHGTRGTGQGSWGRVGTGPRLVQHIDTGVRAHGPPCAGDATLRHVAGIGNLAAHMHVRGVASGC
mmetsp:Transcript_49062/g.91403  ORF Transcript_49062/g.91403 Transcript_49062/m.91403 type:complete len:230 (-) Transcript_49062:1417-2106(-)